MVLHEGGIIRLCCIMLSNWTTAVLFCGVATVLVLHWASFQHQESKSIQEHAAFMDCEAEVVMNVETLRKDGFGDKKCFNCFVAENEKDIIGYVLYFDTYSPAVGKTMYMEDFFVKPDHRGKGVGTMLFKSTVQDCISQGCKRMEWGVFNWNDNALNYYKRRGAVDLTTTEQIHVFRLNEEHMHAMVDT